MVPGTGIETGTRSTTSPRSVAQGRLFGTRDFKLRCFAGVSAAGARSRNPEAQRGISKLTWCPGPESNRYALPTRHPRLGCVGRPPQGPRLTTRSRELPKEEHGFLTSQTAMHERDEGKQTMT